MGHSTIRSSAFRYCLICAVCSGRICTVCCSRFRISNSFIIRSVTAFLSMLSKISVRFSGSRSFRRFRADTPKSEETKSRVRTSAKNRSHDPEFCVTSHPAIVNGLVDEVRKAWDNLHLWKPEQMESHLDQNLVGRVLVVDPRT